MATKAATRRAKRQRRKAPRGVAVERAETARPAYAATGGPSELTDKERRRLADEAARSLSAGARFDPDRMGVRFLELAFCRWTDADFAGYPECLAMVNGHREAWSEAQFRAAAAWWRGLHWAQRAEVIRQTRLCGAKDPVTLGTNDDRQAPVARRVGMQISRPGGRATG
jgi:hypothetical protein